MSAVALADPAARDAVRQQAEQLLCERSFPDFLPRLTLRSDDPHHPDAVAMRPYPYQLDLAERWQAHESQVILKSRQIGCSVLLRAYALWRAQHSGWSIGYYSRGHGEAVAWLDGVEAMANDLPAHLRLVVRRSGDLLRIGRGSIRVFPGTQRGGVSYTFQLVIADEAAHHPYGRENYANYAPTLSAGGQYVCLSTSDPALGPSGWFYEMWCGARDGTLPYVPVFLGWMARTGRDAAWLAARRAEFAGDERALYANYPERPEDAFQGREGLVYPMYDRERHIRTAPVPWEAALRRYAATDYGGGDPTAAVVGGVWRRSGEGFPRLHIYGIGYWRQGAPSVEAIGGYLGKWHGISPFTHAEGDPAPGGEVINESLRAVYGLPFRRGNARRGEGLGLVANWLENGWLTFDESVREIIESEILSYRWLERTDPNNRERYATSTPVDNHADALDAIRLLLMGAYYDELSQRPRTAYTGVQW